MANKNKLCTVSLVFALLLFSLLPSVVSADAAFSSITIADAEPTELHPGDTREVILTVKNNGGMDARDVRLSFQYLKETISPVGPKEVHINTLNSWCSKEVEITMHVKEEAPNGVYPILVNCSWTEYHFNPKKGEGVTEPRSAELGVYFSVIGKGVINIGDVSTDPKDIRPGDEDVEIRAYIENSGEAAAKDIEAKLVCNADFKPSWSGTDRSYIGRLNSGEKGEAIFHIDIADSIESKIYGIPLRIKYKDTKGVEYEVMRSVDILVEPKPEFEIVSFFTEPVSIGCGDHVVLHVRIRNVGSEEGESISVRATGEAEVPFDFDVKSDYVGNLKVNKEGDAILEFDVDKDASRKTYQQKLEIRCTGDRDLGDNNVYTYDKQVSICVSDCSSGFSRSVPGFEVLIALFALLLVFCLIRMRSKGL